MGGKGSKIDALYTLSTSSDRVEKTMRKLVDKLNKSNVNLQRRHKEGQREPTLIITDPLNDSDLEKHLQDSLNLRPNELMVVLTPKVNPSVQSDRLVQLKWTKDNIDTSGKDNNGLNLIEEFLKAGGRPEPSSSADPAVHMAFGDTPDYVLRGAVSFVEEIGGIKLVLATDIHTSSPLLVFCKNDTKLQEDIRHAVENTRRGSDVMLLVVTDNPNLLLEDTEATQNIGAKACLLYDSVRHKYRSGINANTMIWIRNFLAKFGFDVILKLNRKDSVTKTIRALFTGEATGSYYVLGQLPEEQRKSIIVFLDNENIVLHEVGVTAAESTSPLVVFYTGHQQPEQALRQFMKTRKDHKDVHVVVIYRKSHQVPILQGVLRCTVLNLAISDTSPEVLNNAQNKKTVEALKKFLKRQTAPESRSRRQNVQHVFPHNRGSADEPSVSQSHDDTQGSAGPESAPMELDDGRVWEAHDVYDNSMEHQAIQPRAEESPSRYLCTLSSQLSENIPREISQQTKVFLQASGSHRLELEPPSELLHSNRYHHQPSQHSPYDVQHQQPTLSIGQQTRSHSTHFSDERGHLAPQAQPKCPDADGQRLYPPDTREPPYSLRPSDLSYVSSLKSQQSGYQDQFPRIPHNRPFPQATDTQSNSVTPQTVCQAADTIEYVPGTSSKRPNEKSGSWRQRSKRRTGLPPQLRTKGAGDETSIPGGSVKFGSPVQ